MDLVEKFVKLSIRRGIGLKDLAKNPEELNCTLSVFRAVCASEKPKLAEAEQFLKTAADWINASAQELIDLSVLKCEKPPFRLNQTHICKAVEKEREKIREQRRQHALAREKEIAQARLDRSRDEHFMTEALIEARIAMSVGEVPVGAVVVDEKGRIIGRGHNRVITDQDPSAHAEIVALRNAAKARENYRLDNCSLYVTLEPCAMCSGAILGARFKRLIYGAADEKAGAVESIVKLFDEKKLNHHTYVTGGVLSEQSLSLLRTFFSRLRQIRGKKNV